MPTKKYIVILLAVTTTCFQPAFGQQWDVIKKSTFELLKNNAFISGHSLMDNPFADHLQSINESKNIVYNWNQQIGIGSPIRVRTSGNQLPPNNWAGYHTGKNRSGNDMDVIAELTSPTTIGSNEVYNALLITERHDILDVIRWEYSNSLLHHYHNRLIHGNNKAETYLYHSWLNIDPNDPQDWISFEGLMLNAWECVADKVNLTLASEGKTMGVNVIPAGWALANLLQHILDDEVPGFSGSDAQRVDDLFNDTVHLNHEGIYYLSALSFAIINKQSPVGATIPASIQNDTGLALQQLAWQYAEQYLAEYRSKTMSACRQIMINEGCDRYFSFTNRPDQINSCVDWMSNTGFSTNPFNWPDPNLVTWPDP
ncbi:hypothetical protein [Marinicella rhabdoformis]|uniref:hypothetical protein n=1 Tax=Marinicella rhabdoformis TaxID=2580566 RepID=UPI0012AEB946|nr:hypothetical protein [Marinicella rhabdoformis]